MLSQGGSQAAKGVVLFMHGFAQGPNAYYENLKGIADAGFLVVAPVPPFAPTPGRQQASHCVPPSLCVNMHGMRPPACCMEQNCTVLYCTVLHCTVRSILL
jgi:hypothetical protein